MPDAMNAWEVEDTHYLSNIVLAVQEQTELYSLRLIVH